MIQLLVPEYRYPSLVIETEQRRPRPAAPADVRRIAKPLAGSSAPRFDNLLQG